MNRWKLNVLFSYPAQIDSNWTESLWKLLKDEEHRHSGDTSYGRAGHVMRVTGAICKWISGNGRANTSATSQNILRIQLA